MKKSVKELSVNDLLKECADINEMLANNPYIKPFYRYEAQQKIKDMPGYIDKLKALYGNK